MAKSLEISLILKGTGAGVHNQVSKIGGYMPDGSGELWSISQNTAIMGIEAGSWEFHILRANQQIRVIVAHSLYGDKYLAAETDGGFETSLLCLPEM